MWLKTMEGTILTTSRWIEILQFHHLAPWFHQFTRTAAPGERLFSWKCSNTLHCWALDSAPQLGGLYIDLHLVFIWMRFEGINVSNWTLCFFFSLTSLLILQFRQQNLKLTVKYHFFIEYIMEKVYDSVIFVHLI